MKKRMEAKAATDAAKKKPTASSRIKIQQALKDRLKKVKSHKNGAKGTKHQPIADQSASSSAVVPLVADEVEKIADTDAVKTRLAHIIETERYLVELDGRQAFKARALRLIA